MYHIREAKERPIQQRAVHPQDGRKLTIEEGLIQPIRVATMAALLWISGVV